MRRTYRSKRDTGGGVDHRDMVLSVDSKSSVFDAYYIQNIKQVKREMSCIGSSNPYASASYKVRKRKYVKRLKDPEPVRESSESAYLTPDKSIRVNKIPDLFDQLLNTSTTAFSPKTSVKSNNNVHNSAQSRVAKKTYYKKKQSKAKKYNCSSSESTDSDKENMLSDESYSQNTSNIKAHKLVIEKERVLNPIHLDDSINNIAEKLLDFNKLRNISTKGDMYTTSRFSNIVHDVTRSPLLQASPQCSTPFHEKYRGKSIYNFSPIKIDLMETSEKNIVQNTNTTSEISNHQDNCGITRNNSVENGSNIKVIEESSIKNKIEDSRNTALGTQKMDEYEITSTQSLSNVTTSLSTTELEPFLGFANKSSDQNSKHDISNFDNHDFDDLADNNAETHEIIPNIQVSEQSTCKSIDNNSSNSSGNHFDKNDIDLAHSDAETDNSIPNSQVTEQLNCKSIDNNNSSIENSIQSHNATNVYLGDIKNKTGSSGSEFIDSESLYDTCDSESTSDFSFELVKPKELVVTVERLNDSIFQKYYEKMIESSISNESTSSISNNISDINKSDESFKELEVQDIICNNSSNPNIDNVYHSFNSENLEFNDIQIISSSENENSDSNDIEEEDKCLSFVTTRRRNNVTNDSFLFSLDNSSNSASSISLNKTVLSCNRERLEAEVADNTLVNDSTEDNVNTEVKEQTLDDMQILSKGNETELESVKSVSDEEETNINTRNSSRLSRDSTYSWAQNHANETISELRQGIVLKPGKKWERSLSIYRRMTTMGDTFDQSILDDESMKLKGRKYRQSVISTMEMQEHQGSLHNESVFSRRSTFVSKPRRSTIKIFKDPNASNISLSSSILYDDLEGFLNGDCDDTIIELSKLSIGDSGHEVTVLDKFHDTSNRIVTARDYVLRRCNQTVPVLFDECYPDTVLKNCRKIGEGVYGEVFLWRARDGRARVMKIVPIAGATRVNGEEQKDYREIISEIVIAMELSALRAPIPEIERQLDDGKEIDALDLHSVQNATDVFNEVLAVRCVYGSYPSRLLDLWELYDECKGSENDNPAALPTDQQYIVLELANAGQDLESYQFNNAEQAYALFKQIALGLAVAEESFQFEHRDLHWGNVLIAPTDQKYATFVVRGRLHRSARCGVAATLIDYSLSRAAREGRALYNDLADDDALFDAVGDYQFEVYRLMRDKLGNDWKNFEPYTNILWLHYTVDKMITALRYTRTNTKIHKHYIAKLKEIKDRVLAYGSATQFILTDNEF